MSSWNELFKGVVEKYLAPFSDASEYEKHIAPFVVMNKRTKEFLSKEVLVELSSRELIAELKAISSIKIGFQIGRIADVRGVEALRESLLLLTTHKGNAEAKMSVSAIPFFAEAQMSSVLCAYAPHRYYPRTKAYFAGWKKATGGLFDASAFLEMPYDDAANELKNIAKPLSDALAKWGLEDTFLKYRFLIIGDMVVSK